MKRLFAILILVMLGSRGSAQYPTVIFPRPFTNTIAFGNQKQLQAVLVRTLDWVQDPVTESRGQWHIRESLKLGAPGSIAFLGSTNSRPWFRPGELIATNLAAASTAPERLLVQYWWDQGRIPPFGGGWPFSQKVAADIAPGETDIVVGFVLGAGSSARVGWIRYQRAPLIQVYQAWEPVAFDLNPFPGHSIVAGVAPELPKLGAEPVTDSFNQHGIRLSWPAGLDGIELQITTRPDSTALWTLFGRFTGAHSYEYFPQTRDDSLQFFRLVYDY